MPPPHPSTLRLSTPLISLRHRHRNHHQFHTSHPTHPIRLTPTTTTPRPSSTTPQSTTPRPFSTSTTTATTTTPLLHTQLIPAPHTGHIRLLLLHNPLARNALSRALVTALADELEAVRKEVEADARVWAGEAETKAWADGKGEGGCGKAEGKGTGGEGEGEGEVAGRDGKRGLGRGPRALVLGSAVDEAFCAGADLKERRGMSGVETTIFLTHLRQTLHALSALPIPTIAAIHGPAFGGGLELALATDLRVIASTATIALPETRLGIIPGAGGTWRLQGLVGRARAMEMVLTGRRVGGVEAGRMGVGERVVDVDGDGDGGGGIGWEGKGRAREMVLTEAVEMARGICEGAPGAVQAALRAVRGEGEEVEKREYDGVVGMKDRDEALRAFGEKRKAVFRGW